MPQFSSQFSLLQDCHPICMSLLFYPLLLSGLHFIRSCEAPSNHFLYTISLVSRSSRHFFVSVFCTPYLSCFQSFISSPCLQSHSFVPFGLLRCRNTKSKFLSLCITAMMATSYCLARFADLGMKHVFNLEKEYNKTFRKRTSKEKLPAQNVDGFLSKDNSPSSHQFESQGKLREGAYCWRIA